MQHLREDWGEQIYRILLKSQPVASGKWSYEFSAGAESIARKGEIGWIFLLT